MYVGDEFVAGEVIGVEVDWISSLRCQAPAAFHEPAQVHVAVHVLDVHDAKREFYPSELAVVALVDNLQH